MGYMLPLRFIKVSSPTNETGSDIAICATRIVAIMSTSSYYARKTVKEERQNGTLINAAGREAAKSAVWLDNGTVIASPLSVNRILSELEKSNGKFEGKFNTRRLTVYDVVDPEPDPEINEDIPVVATDLNLDELFDEEEWSEENAESDE